MERCLSNEKEQLQLIAGAHFDMAEDSQGNYLDNCNFRQLFPHRITEQINRFFWNGTVALISMFFGKRKNSESNTWLPNCA